MMEGLVDVQSTASLSRFRCEVRDATRPQPWHKTNKAEFGCSGEDPIVTHFFISDMSPFFISDIPDFFISDLSPFLHFRHQSLHICVIDFLPFSGGSESTVFW
jgi:hypothetical protein